MGLQTAYAVRYGTNVISDWKAEFATQSDRRKRIIVRHPFSTIRGHHQPTTARHVLDKASRSVLALTGLTGAAIDGTNTLIAVYAQLASSGLPAAGSIHRTYTANRGLLVPRRLQCGLRAMATLDCEALLFSADGAAHPISISDVAALPTLVANNVLHSIGPITLGIAGSVFTFDCPQNVSIDFGSGADTLGCGSDVYDTHLQYPRSAPVITISGIEASVFGGANAVPPVGKAIDHANSKIFFRRRAANGIGFVADATAQHIRLTANGVAVVTEHTGQGTNRAEVSIQITTSWDGTNAPIAINTAAAIA